MLSAAGRIGVDVDGPDGLEDYVLDDAIPGPTSVTARAFEEDSATSQWAVKAIAVCATT